MKKIIFALCLSLTLPSLSFAQENPFHHKNKSIDVVFGAQSLNNKDNGEKNKSELNIGLRADFTKIKLHKDILADMFRVNFDIGMDINFAKYKTEVTNDYQKGSCLAAGIASQERTGDWNLMQGDVGFAFGPSIQAAPIKCNRDIQFAAFYHFVPSASCLILDNEVRGAFNPFMSFGIVASWKFIGIGYEHRWGSAKYKDFNEDNEDTYGTKQKYSTTANNVFLRFVF